MIGSRNVTPSFPSNVVISRANAGDEDAMAGVLALGDAALSPAVLQLVSSMNDKGGFIDGGLFEWIQEMLGILSVDAHVVTAGKIEALADMIRRNADQPSKLSGETGETQS